MIALSQAPRQHAYRLLNISRHARAQSSYQAPNTPKDPQINHHRQFYRTQGFPVLKAVMIAITTYELLYWSWLKLESLETKEEQMAEVRSLQQEVKDLVKNKTGSG